MLLVGDIPLSVSSGYDVILPDVKPGIWRAVSLDESRTNLRVVWVAPGPLNPDEFPAAESLPDLALSADEMLVEKLGVASCDSGKLGIIDDNMANAVLEAVGDAELAAETIADPFSDEFVSEFALSGGYVSEWNEQCIETYTS